jgi:hypothetical protein
MQQQQHRGRCDQTQTRGVWIAHLLLPTTTKKEVRAPQLRPVALAYISCHAVYHNACPSAVADVLDDLAGVLLTASALYLLCWKRSAQRVREEKKAKHHSHHNCYNRQGRG